MYTAPPCHLDPAPALHHGTSTAVKTVSGSLRAVSNGRTNRGETKGRIVIAAENSVGIVMQIGATEIGHDVEMRIRVRTATRIESADETRSVKSGCAEMKEKTKDDTMNSLFAGEMVTAEMAGMTDRTKGAADGGEKTQILIHRMAARAGRSATCLAMRTCKRHKRRKRRRRRK